jgi:GrpB-like predicted nucleotidyltransferase (UPF0157 family)
MMAAVVLSPYSDLWPSQFERIRADALRIFADESIDMQHIGSTSIPGLCAKPVIDALLGAESLAHIEAKIDALQALGYRYVSKYEDELPMRRYFVRDADSECLRIHLHGVVRDSTLWRQHLTFRDALRADVALRDRYARLKTELAGPYALDKSAYTDAKAPFIRAIIDAALAAKHATS